MIELSELVKQIDDIIQARNGVSQNGAVFFGDLNLHFKNGWRTEQYDFKRTVIQSKGNKKEEC